jgi:hypothetical protein
MGNSEAHQSARNRVEAKMGFYTHLSVYAVVILVLAILDFVTSPSVIWFHWPMFGWGIAIVIHAASVFLFRSRFAVTEEMIEEEMAKSQTHR